MGSMIIGGVKEELTKVSHLVRSEGTVTADTVAEVLRLNREEQSHPIRTLAEWFLSGISLSSSKRERACCELKSLTIDSCLTTFTIRRIFFRVPLSSFRSCNSLSFFPRSNGQAKQNEVRNHLPANGKCILAFDSK